MQQVAIISLLILVMNSLFSEVLLLMLMEMEIMRFIMLTMVDHGALTLGISTL